MPGAMQAVVDAHARWGQRLACASGADRHKVELQLDLVGLTPYFAGRIFSGHELPRSKPAPDVYLAAAERVQCASARCLVIEDSPSGVQAGVAAGATVWALVHAPHLADGLRLAGASRLFHSMAELPALWADGA
jgi:beta-phosphoglucomutase-like phosphatase (HAD superfamily)